MPSSPCRQHLRASGCLCVCFLGLTLLVCGTVFPAWHRARVATQRWQTVGAWLICDEWPEEDDSRESSHEEDELDVKCTSIAYAFSAGAGSLVWSTQGLVCVALFCGLVALVAALVWTVYPKSSSAAITASVWITLAGVLSMGAVVTFERLVFTVYNQYIPNGGPFWCSVAGAVVMVIGGIVYVILACWLSKTPRFGKVMA